MKIFAQKPDRFADPQGCEIVNTDFANVTDFVNIVEMEVDMGFLSNPFFDPASSCPSKGCQRVMYCSCDCNHCSWGIL